MEWLLDSDRFCSISPWILYNFVYLELTLKHFFSHSISDPEQQKNSSIFCWFFSLSTSLQVSMKSSVPCPWRTEGSFWMSYLRSALVNANSVCHWQTFSSSSSLESPCPSLQFSPASSWPPWCTASKGVLPARTTTMMKTTVRTELSQYP